MSQVLRSHLRSNVIAYMALFFAFTGSAYALSGGEVKTKHLANNAVNAKKIRSGAVTAPKIRDGAVTASKMAPGLAASLVGPRGPAGPQGSTGPAGPAGPQGAGSGLDVINSEAAGAVGNPPAFAGTALARGTTITMSKAGPALVFARVFTAAPQCVEVACSLTYGIYVDDQPVPGTVGQVFKNIAGQSPDQVDDTLIAVTAPLSAGAHTVQVRTQATGTSSYGLSARNIGALALGS